MIRAALLSAVLLSGCSACSDPPDPAPTVAVAEVIRGGFELEREDHVVAVTGPTRVEQTALARTATDGRGSLRLDTGGWVLMDRDTEVVVELGKLTVQKGRTWVDVTDAEELEVATAHGSVSASEATFALDVVDGQTRVYCGSGEVTYRSEAGDGQLSQGETLALGQGAPVVEPAAMWDDWTGGLADPTPRQPRGPTYIGVLAGRRIDESGVARTPLPIRGHEVSAVVRGDLAETTVTQTFFNARSDALEAEYAIRIPEQAIVQGFSVDTGGGFVDAAVGTLATTDGYQLSWLDPSTSTSRLSYDGPGRLRARIHPVVPGATVRVLLRYTEWLDRRGDTRTYVYPMASGAEAPLIGEFVLEVDVTGAAAAATRAGMGARVEQGRVVLRESDFRPHASFYLDLLEAEPPPADVAKAHVIGTEGEGAVEGDEKYVLIDVPTEELLEPDDDEPDPVPLEMVLVLDVSGATDPEDLELATGVIESVLRQLAPTDRVAIRLADVTAHVPQGAPVELAEANDETREAILEAVAHGHPGGATDLGESLRQAAALVAGRPRGALLYLGDGIPTTGAIDATSLARVLASVEAPPRFFALAIGDGANLDLLSALFRGQARAVRERTEASRAVMGVLAEAARPTLRGVTVDLGEGIERVYPRPPIAIADGAHLRLVGRLRDDLPKEITVRGSRDGQAFERTMKLHNVQLLDGGDIRRRWATGRLAELLDGDAGREALVELGVRFGVVTPWTSFVVGGSLGQTFDAVRGFDHDPVEVAWALGGRGAGLTVDALGGEAGWRRRARRPAVEHASAPEATWVSRSSGQASAGPGTGDGGLARASVTRAIASGGRGPHACWERKLTVRPDLAGAVTVQVAVDGEGAVKETRLVSSSLGAADVDDCIVTEVRGIRFPATGGTAVTTVSHTFTFDMPIHAMGTRRTCSDASRQSLEVRRALWRERLAASAGVGGALSVWREAQAQCEAGNWRARRTLLQMMLRHVGGVAAQVQLYRAFGPDSSIADWLRRAILRNVRTPQDVVAVRAGLGLDVPVDWSVFARLWRENESPERRLAFVRRWLEVVPEEMDLRLKLLALLEELGRMPEARRLARELRADPLADARVRTAVGEFWLRQEDQAEARRVFSEIVENAPLDPWARKRLGDLYRAHGWADDAYREYQTLARLRPGEESVVLDLARAAADAGRVDEALRLEQRLSESADDETDQTASTFARLWTQVRIARLKLGPARELADMIRRRERETGALRDPPALLVLLDWDHPDDAPELHVRYPTTPEEVKWERAPLLGGAHGIEAVPVREREEGEYLLELRRRERDQLRDTVAELLVLVAPGTGDERIVREEIRLTRTERKIRLKLTDAGALEPVEIPANERDTDDDDPEP